MIRTTDAAPRRRASRRASTTSAVDEVLRQAFDEAIGRIDIATHTERALSRLRARTRAGASSPRPIVVIAVGKAAVAMAEGALRAAAIGNRTRAGATERGSSRIVRALVVAPDGVKMPRGQKDVVCMHAAHPLPDARSIEAADHALALAAWAGQERARLVVLVSGGASSLMAKPARGISLEKKRHIIDLLLRANATISDVNVVRRHLSAVKGGALLAAATDARVHTIVVSDVLADVPWDIGSGPSVPDPTTRADALRVLKRVGALGRHGVSARSVVETPKELRRPGTVTVIASPRTFAVEVARALRIRGLRVRVLPPCDGALRSLVNEYVQSASKLKPGHAIVRAAEPRVAVPARHGKGGRATQLAAMLARRLPPDVAFLAGATDGVDGSSETGGAVVTASSFAAFSRADVERAIASFDAGPLHLRAGTALRGAPTGVNFADVHVLARAPAPARVVRPRRKRARRVTSS